ncbi:hypothetical protein B0H13DRAFT_1872288 [Mycena leptocephala]|nr:hypothetical protein B0H13DRAFT_1872288 [Mycena leptocephala]
MNIRAVKTCIQVEKQYNLIHLGAVHANEVTRRKLNNNQIDTQDSANEITTEAVLAGLPSPWRAAAEPVWPTEPAWDASGIGAGCPDVESILINTNNGIATSAKPPMLAIGVSSRARARRLAHDPSTEVVDVTVAPGALGGRWECGTTRGIYLECSLKYLAILREIEED